MTEFRSLFLEKLQHDQPLNHWAVDFVYTKRDFRDGYLLNLTAGGGWRKLMKDALFLAVMLYGIIFIWSRISNDRNPGLLCGLLVAFFAMPILKVVQRRKKRYFGSLRFFFGDQGLQLQYSSTLARFSWSQFIGFLENSRVLLLYLSPRNFVIVPKRALAEREAQLNTLLIAKLPRYDYRHPVPTAKPELAGQAQSVSK